MGIQGRAAIVTGGAQGIGLAIARLIAQRGAKVVLTDVNLEKAKEQSDKLNAEGYTTMAAYCDVSRPESIEASFKEIAEKFSGIDILVNNAGILFSTPVEEITEKEWDLVMAINLKGCFFCMQKALPYLKGRMHPRIINISSVAGKMGSYASGMAYVASKGGILSLTYGMSRRMAPHHITVNAVCPGTIETDIIRQWAPEKIAELTANIPLGRLGHAEDIAQAVAFLADDENDFITGEAISVNGGMYCG